MWRASRAAPSAAPGNIEFVKDNYTVDSSAGSIFIDLTRRDGSLGPVSATFATGDFPVGPGAASAGVNYLPLVSTPTWRSTYNFYGNANLFFLYNTWMLSDALQGPNNNTFGNPPVLNNVFFVSTNDNVSVTVLNSFAVDGDRALNLTLSQPKSTEILFLGGQNIPLGTALGRASARLTVVNDNVHHGVIGFGATNYTVNENGITATINVFRTDGSDGQVSVDYTTSDGTAVANCNIYL